MGSVSGESNLSDTKRKETKQAKKEEIIFQPNTQTKTKHYTQKQKNTTFLINHALCYTS